jgi:hypothetical protein
MQSLLISHLLQSLDYLFGKQPGIQSPIVSEVSRRSKRSRAAFQSALPVPHPGPAAALLRRHHTCGVVIPGFHGEAGKPDPLPRGIRDNQFSWRGAITPGRRAVVVAGGGQRRILFR